LALPVTLEERLNRCVKGHSELKWIQSMQKKKKEKSVGRGETTIGTSNGNIAWQNRRGQRDSVLKT